MRQIKKIIAVTLTTGLLFTAASCKLKENTKTSPTPSPAAVTEGTEPVVNEPTATPVPTPTEKPAEPVDYSVIKPNESGEIPIVMFHNFIEDLNDTTDDEWTTSFGAFEQLLDTLYQEGYRLISMRDFIDHNIAVPAGTRPMVFTFDDGSAGQFNLIEENGKLTVNLKSAVGVMLKFHEKHPDFGLKGIFYLNMDKEGKTFEGAGSVKERLDILLGFGFEVGNHSWGHFSFDTAKDRAQINEKLGKNEKRLEEIMAGMKFYSLALPFGSKAPADLTDAMRKGNFEGVEYSHENIMAVGYLPSVPSIHIDYDPTYVRRIRSQGKIEIKFDLTYWLPNMTAGRMYISDGDPETVVVPKGSENRINMDKLAGKRLITY